MTDKIVTKHKESLVCGDELVVSGTRVIIRTLNNKNELTGHISHDFERPVLMQDVEIIKGFYSQGLAAQRRLISEGMTTFLDSISPVTVCGVGYDLG